MNAATRPELALRALGRDYPALGRWVDAFLAEKGGRLPDWPAHVLLPVEGWRTIVADRHADETGDVPLEKASEISRVAALGAWRYSQGIWRVADEVREALLDSPIEGPIPSEVLHRLPEWCVYVETPGMERRGEALHGFWAHLERRAYAEDEALRFLLDSDFGLEPLALPLRRGGVAESLEGFVESLRARGIFVPEERAKAEVFADAGLLSRLLSLVLYLCSDAPERDGPIAPGGPRYPAPKKIKRGWALFPARSARIVRVGGETARELREAREEEAVSPARKTGKTKRAHLRRGHWHGYWTGPRGDEARPQKFLLRWLPPLIAGGRVQEEKTA